MKLNINFYFISLKLQCIKQTKTVLISIGERCRNWTRKATTANKK